MITRPTVLVLGAGASAPYGFPIGKELVDIIYESLMYEHAEELIKRDTSHVSIYAKQGYMKTIEDDTISKNQLVNKILKYATKNEIELFRLALKLSQLNSVDAFLEHRVEFMQIGKMAIAGTLLKYENEDAIFNGTGDWYRYIWNRLNTSYSKFQENKLKIITFNYDRSIEHYFHTAFMAMFDKDDNEAAEKLKAIEIVHLHGKLGNLKWESQDDNFTSYGEKVSLPEKLAKVSESIRIIHEEIDENPEFKRAYEIIHESENIFFLGFGFAETNLRRLGFYNYKPTKSINLAATALGMTEQECELIRSNSGLPIRMDMYHGCLDFLREQTF